MEPRKEFYESEDLPEPEGRGDEKSFLNVFRELEILTPKWRKRLEEPSPRKLAQSDRAMLRYLISRYWLQSISDL